LTFEHRFFEGLPRQGRPIEARMTRTCRCCALEPASALPGAPELSAERFAP